MIIDIPGSNAAIWKMFSPIGLFSGILNLNISVSKAGFSFLSPIVNLTRTREKLPLLSSAFTEN